MIKHDRSYGVILFYRFPRSVKYLVLKHRKGHWAFPKGHAEKGETYLETAIRELREETGIKKIELLAPKALLEERYNIENKSGKKIEKIVRYFAAESKTDKVKIDGKEILNYKWCTFEGAEKVLSYPKSFTLLKRLNKLVLKTYDK